MYTKRYKKWLPNILIKVSANLTRVLLPVSVQNQNFSAKKNLTLYFEVSFKSDLLGNISPGNQRY